MSISFNYMYHVCFYNRVLYVLIQSSVLKYTKIEPEKDDIKVNLKTTKERTFLVVQWLRTHLARQGIRVPSLAREL